jgi:hypothetical protein
MNAVPDYETPEHRSRESDTVAIAAARLGLSATFAPRFQYWDCVFTDSTGAYVAIAEVKCRNVRSDRYPTYLISARKYRRLRQYAHHYGLRAYLIVDWVDRIGLWDATDRPISETVMGGRTDRNDPHDIEPMVSIHPVNFTTLHVRTPNVRKGRPLE